MIESIIKGFEVWTDAQGIKSKGRVKSIDNISHEGVARLRELILELAIQGKLVSQNADDVPASELLKKINQINEQLIKDGKLRKIRPLPTVNENEYPFTLPSGWEFVRLNEIGVWGSGATPNRSNPDYYGGNIPWFKSGELSSDFIDTSEEYITEKALKETSVRYNNVDDVLIAMYGATIGKTSILKARATTNQAVCACTPFYGIESTFLLTLLKAYKNRFTGMGAGGAQPNISREKIINTVIGLPPTEEQKRIVVKVNELMLLCDKLEQQQTTNLTTHQQLVKSLLATLTNAANAYELQAAWQKLAAHFDTLFCTEDSIEQLKQTILQLSIMGRLVEQDPNDESASELVKKIASEKQKLAKEGKIKPTYFSAVVDEKSFDLPDSWLWVKLGVVGVGSTGKTPSTSNLKYFGGDIPFIGPGQISNDGNISISDKTLTEEGIQYSTTADSGDILMVCIGGSIGKSAIVKSKVTFNQQLNCITPILMDTNYLFSLFNSPYFQQEVLKKATGSATPIINRGKWEEIPIPIAPLSEQKRIVARVNKLFDLCNLISSKVEITQEKQNLLAQSVIELIN